MFTKCNKLDVLSALFNPKITKMHNLVAYMIYCFSVQFYRNSIANEQQKMNSQRFRKALFTQLYH